jgi:hypothetical protein
MRMKGTLARPQEHIHFDTRCADAGTNKLPALNFIGRGRNYNTSQFPTDRVKYSEYKLKIC